MPLINSPIDGAQIRQINRHGIEFDACAATGGVWLDRGELEKRVVLAKEETRSEIGGHDNRRAGFDEGGFDDDRQPMGGKRRSRLSDLFDF